MGRAPYRIITDEWRTAVKRALTEMGFDQEWLAQKVNAKPATVSYVLNGRVKTSSFVEAISNATHVALPDYVDRVDQETIEKLRAIYDADPKEYRRLAETIVRTHAALSDRLEEKPEKKRNK